MSLDCSQLRSAVYPLGLVALSDGDIWTPFHVFRGGTVGLTRLSCHVSALASGESPHAPHSHKEEELLLVLNGEVDLVLQDATSEGALSIARLTRNEFVYYPAKFLHTLRTASAVPANYLMFKWYVHSEGYGNALSCGKFSMAEHEPKVGGCGFSCRRVFEGPTQCLKKLHCHVSVLGPGAGYEPHVDQYDVAIVICEGEVETLGKRMHAPGVIFYAAGEPHGIRNSGRTLARYLVFEFHVGTGEQVRDTYISTSVL